MPLAIVKLGLEEAREVDKLAPLIIRTALASMDMETYRSIIQPCFSAVPESDLGRWHRNATRALRNPQLTTDSEQSPCA